MKPTPIHDAVMEIIKNNSLASEREQALRELLNIQVIEGAQQVTEADKIVEALAVRLGIEKNTSIEETTASLYPSMKKEETPADEPLEGFDEGLKTFAKSFYTTLKEDAGK